MSGKVVDGSRVLIEMLAYRLVVSIEPTDDRKSVVISDGCHGEHHASLTKDQVAQLGRELIHMSRDLVE